MSLDVLIAGTSYANGSNSKGWWTVEFPTLKAAEDIYESTFEMTLDVTINNQAVDRPRTGDEFVLMNGINREFAGVLLNVKETQIDVFTCLYTCQVTSYAPWFRHHLVIGERPQETADTRVKWIVNTFVNMQGNPITFTTNNTLAAPLVPARKYDYVDSYQAVKDLADYLQWNFWLDYYKDVHFMPSANVITPLPNNILDVDSDLANYGDLVLEEDGGQVINRVFAKGFTTISTSAITVYFSGDGTTKNFRLPYTPARPATTYMTVTVGGVSYSVKNDITDGRPESPQVGNYAFVNYSSQNVRFDAAPGAGTNNIAVTFHYAYQPVYMAEDPAAQKVLRSREGTDGIYEYVISDPNLSASDTSLAEARLQFILAKYGTPILGGTFYSFLQGWRAGQYFTLTSARRFSGDFAVGVTMYISKVTKTVVSTDPGQPTLRYDIACSDRPFVV